MLFARLAHGLYLDSRLLLAEWEKALSKTSRIGPIQAFMKGTGKMWSNVRHLVAFRKDDAFHEWDASYGAERTAIALSVGDLDQ